MVSADNLNHDVLGFIFSHLSGNDLVSVSLVSRSFLLAVIPRLYNTLTFAHAQAKRYPKTISPFYVILSHPFLAVHVRACEISAIPLYKNQPHHAFLAECIRALEICTNLSRFSLSNNILPSFLQPLTRKQKLTQLRVNVSLTMEQSVVLSQLQGIQNLTLVHASWCMMSVFPSWLEKLAPTLTHLTISMTSEINNNVLEDVLKSLPNLLGLHLLSCLKIEHDSVFKLLQYTPLLESLAVTTWEIHNDEGAAYAMVPQLKRLALDSRYTFVSSSTQQLWATVLRNTQRSRAPLESLTLKCHDHQTLNKDILDLLLTAHSDTLRSLRLVNCDVDLPAIRKICIRCKKLEEFALNIPMNGLTDFMIFISQSESLKTLIDVPPTMHVHPPRPTLNRKAVRDIMRLTNIHRIICHSRTWTGNINSVSEYEESPITLERTKFSSFPSIMSIP